MWIGDGVQPAKILAKPSNAWSVGGSRAAYTTHGIAPGSAYATYEQQNKMNFLVLAGTAALPAGGYGLFGPAVSDAMLVSGGVAGGFDAAGQYAQNCAQGNCKVSAINPVQSLLAVNSAMVAGPAIGPLGTWGAKVTNTSAIWNAIFVSGVSGAGVGYVNTSFNNKYNGESNSAFASSILGGSAGVLGSAFGVGVFRWTGSVLNGSGVDNLISNFPSFLPAPSVDNVKNRLGGMKYTLIKVMEWIYIVISWPFLWVIGRIIAPKRVCHLLLGLFWAGFAYLFIGHGYDWMKCACGYADFFCDNSTPPSSGLTAWRYMYGTPIFLGFSVVVIIKFVRYMVKVNRRLRRWRITNCGAVLKVRKRWVWWL